MVARPFVENPWRRWLLGVILGVAAIVVAAARVAAHVHHVQDVVAGLAIGAVAAALGLLLARALITRLGLQGDPGAMDASFAETGTPATVGLQGRWMRELLVRRA